MKYLDLLAPGIIGIIAGALLIMTAKLGRTASLFPKILSLTIIVLVVYYIVEELYKNFKQPATLASKEEAPGAKEAPMSGRWEIMMASMAVYLGLIYLIGFAAASFFYGIFLPYLGGYRRMKVTIPVALGMAALLVLIGKVFNIPLPAGLLITSLIN